MNGLFASSNERKIAFKQFVYVQPTVVQLLISC